MALDLNSVQGYIKDVRALLLDKVKPYRYSDTALIVGLNLALREGRRLRPDLFTKRGRIFVPTYEVPSGEVVPIEEQFRLAFVYGIAGHVLFRDEEDVQDARANGFRSMFESMLVGVRVAPMAANAGTPSPRGGDKSQNQ